MYTYVEAVLREKGLNTVWQKVDIRNLTLPAIFKRFISGHIKLTHPQLDDPQYVDLEELKGSKLPIVNLTFSQWLSYIGNQTIPASDIAPTYRTTTITYADAWAVGYKPVKMHPTYGLGYTLLDEQNTDLYISRTDIEGEKIQKHAMVTINGYFHLCIPFKNGLRVVNGMQTINNMNRNNIGIVSFANVGELQHQKISEDMISLPRDGSLVREGVFVHLHKDIQNKSILLTSGGYLNVGGEVMEIINPEIGLIKINVSKLNIERRYLESQNHLNLDLDLSTNDNMPNAFSINEMRSNEKLIRYLISDHTFLTIVDTPVIYYEHKPISNVPLFGFYESVEFPKYPLVTHLGRLMDFVAVKSGDFWSIRANEHYQKFYAFETRPMTDQYNINDIVTASGYEKELGFQLILGKMERMRT